MAKAFLYFPIPWLPKIISCIFFCFSFILFINIFLLPTLSSQSPEDKEQQCAIKVTATGKRRGVGGEGRKSQLLINLFIDFAFIPLFSSLIDIFGLVLLKLSP